MAKVKVSDWSATPANNTDIDGINVAENCPPSGINDAIREMMSQLKDFQTGAAGDSFNGPVGTTTAAAGAFTTLSASGAVTLSGGTANGIPYLNASKVLTTGSALTFDGTNLGIGTSSPGYKLTVNGFTAVSGPQAAVKQTAEANAFSGIAVQRSTNDSTLGLAFNSIADAWQISASYASSGAYKPIQLLTGDTVRATLDSIGNLLVGTTSQMNSEKFGVLASNAAYTTTFRNSNATPNGSYINYSGASPNNTANEFIYASDTTTLRFSVRSNGGIANYSANNVTLSDRREKTNFSPAKSYLDVICAIPVQTYNYIDQNMENDPGLTLGVVAQDVQAIAPELVTESNWGTEKEPKMRLSIYQTDLQYALMKCIQEQQTQISDQLVTIGSLKARLDALEAA